MITEEGTSFLQDMFHEMYVSEVNDGRWTAAYFLVTRD